MSALDATRKRVRTEVTLPDFDHAQIVALAKRIKPLVHAGNGFATIKPVDLFGVAYAWDPKPVALVQRADLVEVAVIQTLHTCGHPVMFKPSIAEVLGQIPDKFLDKVDYFVTDHAGGIDQEGGYLHVGETILYRKR